MASVPRPVLRLEDIEGLEFGLGRHDTRPRSMSFPPEKSEHRNQPEHGGKVGPARTLHGRSRDVRGTLDVNNGSKRLELGAAFSLASPQQR